MLTLTESHVNEDGEKREKHNKNWKFECFFALLCFFVFTDSKAFLAHGPGEVTSKMWRTCATLSSRAKKFWKYGRWLPSKTVRVISCNIFYHSTKFGVNSFDECPRHLLLWHSQAELDLAGRYFINKVWFIQESEDVWVPAGYGCRIRARG